MKYCSDNCRRHAKQDQNCDNSFAWYHRHKHELGECRRYGLGSGTLGQHMNKEGFKKEAESIRKEFRRLNLTKRKGSI